MSDQVASEQGASKGKEIVIHEIRPLGPNESNYVRPLRMTFSLNGKVRNWDVVKSHDSVASVIYNKSRNKLIYVKQFRPAVYLSSISGTLTDLASFDSSTIGCCNDGRTGYTLELCAGLADKKGKTRQEVMKEEILEETGYEVPLDSVKFLSSFRGSVGLNGTLMHLFFAEVTDEQRVNQGGGVDDEDIEVLEIDVEETKKFIYCRDEDACYARPPTMLFGTSWFLNEYYPKLPKTQ